MTVAEMKEIEPALQGELYNGWYTPSDFTGDIHKFTNGLADACERLGVTMGGRCRPRRPTRSRLWRPGGRTSGLSEMVGSTEADA